MADEDEEPVTPGYEGARDDNGKRHGQGVATHKNGDVYTGSYVHGQRQGQGVYTFKAGGRYEGGYHRNKKDGKGTMTYANGTSYRGDWCADRRHGSGVYTYANGDSYDGGWKEGARHGKGTYFFRQHKCQFFGYWSGGSFAWGTWVFQDGTTFAGKFEDGPLARPASRAPATLHTANSQQTGAFRSQRWRARSALSPVSGTPSPTRIHASGALPRRFPMRHLKPEKTNLTSILAGMDYDVPAPALPRAQTPAVAPIAEAAEREEGAKNIIIYGPPGSGRRTQTAMVAEKYGGVVISMGGLLRQAIHETGNPLQRQRSEKVKLAVTHSDFVPDEIVQELLGPALQSAEVQEKGFVMYGYPRTAAQAAHLQSLGVQIDAFVVLDFSLGTSKQDLIERCAMRRVDPETGTVHSLLEHEAIAALAPEVRKRLVVPEGEYAEGDIEKRIGLFDGNSADVIGAFPSETVFKLDGDRSKLAVLADIGSAVFGEEGQAVVQYSADRSKTLVKKLPWSLRDEYHDAPETLVDNSELFDVDPDLDSNRLHHTKSTVARGRKPLVVLHFNDVYEIKEGKQEPVGGASRIAGKLHEFDDEHPLVLFSGDALNPSLISQSTRGSHMIEVLNALGVAASVIGNHDMDFGVENLCENIAKSHFPWLCSNCWHKETGEPLAGAIEACVVQHQGYNIGLVGLIEEEWLECCSTVNPDCLDFTDLVVAGTKVARKLREEEDVDLVIALTHFREPNDERLAVEVPEIDLVLGGHDHHYSSKKCEPHGQWYVKSGADFRYLSKITVELPDDEHPEDQPMVTVEKHDIDRSVPEDETVKAICDKYLVELEKTMGRVIGHVKTELEARFSLVRTEETNVGNWCADTMRSGCKCDIVLLNSGTLRADCTYPVGPFTLEDLMKLLPFANELMVVELTGAQVLHCLENSVSGWPKKEGRFVQVSGVKFEFDGSKDPMGRVTEGSVMTACGRYQPGTEQNPYVPLDLEKKYSVGALDFAAKGNEGFTAFLEGTVLMDEEVCTP